MRPKPFTSQARSALADFCAGVGRQMVFWGCDARHPDGNLLVRLGMERLPRQDVGPEGSSRYRARWQGGWIEIHSFHAGWHQAAGPGIVFVRRWQRCVVCGAGLPAFPGDWDFVPSTRDELLDAVAPLASWIVEYERRVHEVLGPAYRESCHRHTLSMPGVRPWLPPGAAEKWIAEFLDDPSTVRRVRDMLHREEAGVFAC